MPKKRKTGHIFWKDGQGQVLKAHQAGARAYADLRDYRDVIQKTGDDIKLRMALIPKGSKSPTTDLTVAEKMVGDLVVELEGRRRDKALGVVPNGTVMTLGTAATIHLKEKAQLEDVTDNWLRESEHMLTRALDFFGAHRDVRFIEPSHVRDWIKHLGGVDNGRGGRLSGGTIRHHINCLSNLFGTALEKGWVVFNPVQGLRRGTKPSAKRQEAAWFESPEASLILEAAFRYKSRKAYMAIPFPGPLIATFLLTGGRKSEVLGLTAEDIAFDRNLIHIRPNAFRRLKTGNATRQVRLWPQLREILQKHVFEDGHVSGLLFPSPAGTGMIRDLEKMLDGIANFIGWEEGSIRSKMFRHTYCSARLQTLDHGAPVSPFTVAQEMGHGGDSLVKRIYGHLGTFRHRSEHVEFRVENHEETLKDNLEALK